MGFIANLKSDAEMMVGQPSRVVREAVERGRSSWREIFATDKETAGKTALHPVIPPGGSYGRSNVSQEASTRRLIQAMRSMAPGGWSDDRWSQTNAYRNVTYACFPPGTRVRMADGTNKPIESVQLRELVVTAEGNVHKVTHCFVRQHDGQNIRLKLWGHRHLHLTPNHEVLTRRGYVPAEALAIGDWVAIPRYQPERITVLQTENHVSGETAQIREFYPDRPYGHPGRTVPSTGGNTWKNYRRIPDLIDLSPQFGRILGLYLAEAHTHCDKSILWSFDAVKERDTLIPELVGLLEGFGFVPKLYTPPSNRSVTQVIVNSKMWVRLFHSLCGKLAHGKKLHSDVLAGPDDFLKAVVDGWLAGDGCTKKGTNHRTGATVSRDLALNMFDIGNHLGLRPVLFVEKKVYEGGDINGRRIKSRSPTWKVAYHSGSDNYRVEMDATHVWRKVAELERLLYSGEVFNLEVEGDNSYVAEGIGVHNCIHRTGEQMYQSEFEVFERDDNHPDGKKPVKKGTPGWDLVKLLEKPNGDDTFGDLLYGINQQLDLTGMGLTWMLPNAAGTIRELYVIPTAIAIPQPAINPDFPDGYWRIQPVYPYGPFSSYPTPTTAVGAPIPAQWMIRIKYQHPLLRYDGFSPQTAMRLMLDTIEQIDQSRAYSMKGAIDPSAVLQFDEMEGAQPLPEEEIERIRAEFGNNHQGSQNAGQLYVTPPGSKLEPWGGKPNEMEYQAGWEQLTSFVMGAGFGITKPAAGMVEDSSYATLFASMKQLHLQTLSPKCCRIAAKLTRHLAPFFGDNLIIDIKPQRIDDHEILNGKLDKLVQSKGCTVNELRRALDWPLTKEEWGEERVGAEPQQGPGAMPPGGPAGPPPGPGQAPAPPPLGGEAEATASPGTGTLGEGSKGPAKHLQATREEINALRKQLNRMEQGQNNGQRKLEKNTKELLAGSRLLASRNGKH